MCEQVSPETICPGIFFFSEGADEPRVAVGQMASEQANLRMYFGLRTGGGNHLAFDADARSRGAALGGDSRRHDWK